MLFEAAKETFGHLVLGSGPLALTAVALTCVMAAVAAILCGPRAEHFWAAWGCAAAAVSCLFVVVFGALVHELPAEKQDSWAIIAIMLAAGTTLSACTGFGLIGSDETRSRNDRRRRK